VVPLVVVVASWSWLWLWLCVVRWLLAAVSCVMCRVWRRRMRGGASWSCGAPHGARRGKRELNSTNFFGTCVWFGAL
jgi:hypothetical protein